MEVLNSIKAARTRSIIYTGIGLIFFPVYQLVCLCWIRQHLVFGFFSSLINVIIGAVILHQGGKNKTKYKSLYKDVLVKQILDEEFEDIVYQWENGYTKTDVAKFHLIVYSDLYSKDYLKASYKGFRFEQADISCSEVHGKIMKISSLPVNTTEVQIYTRNFRNVARYWDENKSIFFTELEKFNMFFDIKAYDEEAVKKVLTPQLQNNLIALAMNGCPFGITFIGNTAYIVISTYRKSFDIEAGLKKVNFDDELAKVREDVQSIKDWIELIGDGSAYR